MKSSKTDPGRERKAQNRKESKQRKRRFLSNIHKYILKYITRGGLVRPLNPYRFTRHANDKTHARTRKTRAHARKYVYKQNALSCNGSA